ncbi:MAG TPA: hypothetical protein VMS64_40505 [Candidatus Methylomirabilis sp.]|nr:hypothetical protein [Candidatus Methylomirabilis sp.]
MRSKILLSAAMLALAIAMGVLAFGRPSGAQGGARVGQTAPEIAGGPWINSAPLTMDKLRGRVVFVEFWTFG